MCTVRVSSKPAHRLMFLLLYGRLNASLENSLSPVMANRAAILRTFMTLRPAIVQPRCQIIAARLICAPASIHRLIQLQNISIAPSSIFRNGLAILSTLCKTLTLQKRFWAGKLKSNLLKALETCYEGPAGAFGQKVTVLRVMVT